MTLQHVLTASRRPFLHRERILKRILRETYTTFVCFCLLPGRFDEILTSGESIIEEEARVWLLMLILHVVRFNFFTDSFTSSC